MLFIKLLKHVLNLSLKRCLMKKRRKISRRKSKKLFSKTALRSRKLNFRANPMRGGFSL